MRSTVLFLLFRVFWTSAFPKTPRLLRALAAFLALCLTAPALADNPGPAADGRTLAVATFAGGCFWCMEADFDKLDGVVSTTSGYTGGNGKPTYEQVSAGGTGHAEAVRIVYDRNRIDYDRLLDVFWRNVDLLDAGGQFCDRGDQYRSAIFYETEEEKRLAERSKAKLSSSGRFDQPIVTAVVPASPFYPAEDYHQNYYQKNPLKYKFYRFNCGRDRRLEELWGKPASDAR